MALLEISFGEAGGGTRSFKSSEQLLEALKAEVDAWSSDPDLQFLFSPRDPSGGAFNEIVERWSSLRTHVASWHQAQSMTEAEIAANANSQLRSASPISRHSAAGTDVADIAKTFGWEAAAGAVAFHHTSPEAALPQGFAKSRWFGMLDAWARSAGVNKKGASAARAAADRLQKSLEADVVEHRRELDEFRDNHRKRIEELNVAAEEQQANFDQMIKEKDISFAQKLTDWTSAWNQQYEVFTEQLKIEAPVKLWSDQAVQHDKSAGRIRKTAILVALSGTVMTIAVAAGATEFAQWLFSEALATSGSPAAAGDLRPTWAHEAAFVAGAILLYLTLLFWVMRILVRMLMTEHHLAIDARSRASMANTYLALTKEGAASDADRAIVLASLFRPVVDGIVKDDALPLISPATILSGQLMPGGGRAT